MTTKKLNTARDAEASAAQKLTQAEASLSAISLADFAGLERATKDRDAARKALDAATSTRLALETEEAGARRAKEEQAAQQKAAAETTAREARRVELESVLSKAAGENADTFRRSLDRLIAIESTYQRAIAAEAEAVDGVVTDQHARVDRVLAATAERGELAPRATKVASNMFAALRFLARHKGEVTAETVEGVRRLLYPNNSAPFPTGGGDDRVARELAIVRGDSWESCLASMLDGSWRSKLHARQEANRAPLSDEQRRRIETSQAQAAGEWR